MRRKLTFLSLLLVIALLLGMMPFGMFRMDAYAATADPAEDQDTYDVEGDKSAAPTELDPLNRETTVTLKLPSGEYKYEYDIVFVMDSSSSTANSKIDFSEYAADLMDVIKDKNIDLKVGVIKARGLVFDTISLVTEDAKNGLVKYSEENKQDILDAINFAESELKKLSSGTNMHGALLMADEWLSADTEVPDDHKFVFFLLDGKTYIWNDENDIPTSVYGQYMAKNTVYSKPAVGQQTIAYSKSAYRFTDEVNFFKATADDLATLSFDEYFKKTGNFYTNDYAKLYASKNTELSEPTKYDYRCGYAYKESATASGTVNTHDLTNANYTYNLHKKYYEFVPDEAFADLNWLQANPYTVEENNGTYSYTTTINPDFYQLHPDGLQKALYLTGHLWTDMVAKYNGAVINYNGWGGGSGLEIAKSFNEWILSKGISDYAADISNADSVSQIFNTVKDDILYMISEGVVTDIITNEFTLKNPDNENAFRMTLNGEALDVTYADGKWNFGEAVSGVYPYVVSFDGQKTITWELNVPVENLKPVTLSYDLIIDVDAVNGNHDTNVSAVLDYVSTDGKYKGKYTFKVPVVKYNATAPYVVKYLEDGTLTPVEEEKQGDPTTIGTFVSEAAIKIKGYILKEGEPETKQLKITSVAADNVITFLYTALKSTYKINHIDEETQAILQTENGEDVQVGKMVSGSAIQFTGYELSPNQPETKEIEIKENVEENIIEFLYRKLVLPITIEHWLEGWTSDQATAQTSGTSSASAVEFAGLAVASSTTDPSKYGLYQTDKDTGKYGDTYTAEKLNPIPNGYHYDEAVTNELGKAEGTIGEDGLVLKLYYSKDVTPTPTPKPDPKPDPDPTDEPEPIDDPDTPLAPAEEEPDEPIDDSDTPLAPAEIDEDTEIDEEPTPFSPFTGDARHTGVWAGGSVITLLGIIFLGKKRKVNE